MGDYNDIADEYDDTYIDKACLRENQAVREMLEPRVNERPRVVDIGCGTGLFLELLSPDNYLGIDPAEGMLKRLQEKFPGRSTRHSSFENTEVPSDGLVVSLFGSISYVHPLSLDLSSLGRFFLMFYRNGYLPLSHRSLGVDLPYFEFGEYFIPKGVTTFHITNYTVATNLGISHEDILRRNGF